MTQEELKKIAMRYAHDELKDNHGDVEDIVASAFMDGANYADSHPRWVSVFLDFKDLVYYESDDKRIKATNSEGMKNTPNGWSIHIDTEDMCTMAYGEVTYVHEFQHLLRFCGINKEIEI